jgi:hypothetical protein
MAKIEILVEEKSMKELLSVILPKIVNERWVLDYNYFIRSFEGKSDLQKGIPKKVKVLSNWPNEATGVVILQDQDSSDCKVLKKKLLDLCNENGNCPRLVRIVCLELEAWYIGDFEAVNKAYPSFKYKQYINKAKFRKPDSCNACDELKKILPEFQKVSSAKKIAPFLNFKINKSESFNQTIRGIRTFFDSIED